MLHGIRPPGKWNEAFVNKITSTWPEALKYVKDFHRLQCVYSVLGFFYEPSLSFCDVRWNAVMTCLYHCISTWNKCKIKIELSCLNINAQNQVSQLSYSKYMENRAVLEPIDKQILLLEYSSPSHTGGILMSFLDHN